MQTVNLQIIPNGVLPRVNVSQFDVGRQIQFKLYDGAVAYTIPTGTEVRVDGIKPDKHGFSYDATWSGNTVTVTTTEQMTVLNGDIPCELRLIKNDDNIGTLNFILAVEKSPIDGDTDISDTDIPAIIELATEQMERAEAAADNAHDSEVNAKASEDAAALSETNAGNSATAAHDSELAAAASESNADGYATLAESWAVGGTDTRTGEDTNNSFYFSEISRDKAQEAKADADRAEFYADFVTPHFIIANNRLYMRDDAGVEFTVANNRLYIRTAS